MAMRAVGPKAPSAIALPQARPTQAVGSDDTDRIEGMAVSPGLACAHGLLVAMGSRERARALYP
jgi:hypothetical protein